jgi:hypothetical protein
MDTSKLKAALDACRAGRNVDSHLFPLITLVEALAEMALQGQREGEEPPPIAEPQRYRALRDSEVFLPRTSRTAAPDPDGLTAYGAAWDKTADGALTPAVRYPDGHVEVVVTGETAAERAVRVGLLDVEWRGGDGGDSVDQHCATCGALGPAHRGNESYEQYHPGTHDPECLLDIALTAIGLPDEASRDVARKELGLTISTEWGKVPYEDVDE